MGTLRIHLFGKFQLHLGTSPREIPLIPNVQTLLALLLIQAGREMSKKAIAGILWSERTDQRAHCCLNTSLWRLRQALEPEGTPRGTYLHCRSNGNIGFNWESDHWLDVVAFEKCAGPILAVPPQVLSAEDAGLLEDSLPLYCGDFMENCTDDWVLGERERMLKLYMRCLAHLMTYFRIHGQCDQALMYGDRILKLDPLREEIHRELMLIYVQMGQRPMAVRQYEVCRAGLMAELGILPMPETRQLHSRIVLEESLSPVELRGPLQQGQLPPMQAGMSIEDNHSDLIDLHLAFERVSSALLKIEGARRDIQNIYEMLQRSQPPG